jgi:AcrR family transcriptional regulator
MGSAERRAREKQQLRDAIVDTARRLFAENGYDAVTMRAVAEAIDYSPTAIYLHFADKDALLAEVVGRDFAALAEHFQKLAGRIEDPIERLVACGRAYVDFGLENPHHYLLMFVLPRPRIEGVEQKPHIGDPRRDAYAFLRMLVAECIRQDRFRPEIADVEQTAQICWAAMHGIVSLVIAHNHDRGTRVAHPRDLTQRMLQVLVRGLARDPKRRENARPTRARDESDS